MYSFPKGHVPPAFLKRLICLVDFRLQWWGGKRGERSGGLGSSRGVIPGRLHYKGGTAAKSSRLRRSHSGLAAKNWFRLFRCAWVKIPNTFAFLPFFLGQPFWSPCHFWASYWSFGN